MTKFQIENQIKQAVETRLEGEHRSFIEERIETVCVGMASLMATLFDKGLLTEGEVKTVISDMKIY